MRLTILASLLVGLLAGVVGALIVVFVLHDHAETEQAVGELQADLDRLSTAQLLAAEAAALRDDIQGLMAAIAPSIVLSHHRIRRPRLLPRRDRHGRRAR